MKRHGNLYPQILDFENLLLAARKAQRGKRYRPPVLAFNDRLESNLLQLQRELRERTYQPGAYKTFEIYEPKRRLISAAPYRDRVVHHALCNIIVPIFDRTFIATSYANRTGYGTHRALRLSPLPLRPAMRHLPILPQHRPHHLQTTAPPHTQMPRHPLAPRSHPR